MKAVIQRVTRASVEVDGRIVGQVEPVSWCYWGVAKGRRGAICCIWSKTPHPAHFADDQGR